LPLFVDPFTAPRPLTLSQDTLPFIRTQAIGLIYVLLKQKPEQEQNLLRMLVNKLGDTEKTVASRASYHLLQLLQTHPAMKTVVVREVSSLVLAPPPPKTAEKQKQAPKKKGKGGKGKGGPAAAPTGKDRDDGNYHARYYGLITLNQTTLTQKDGEVAGKLCEVYFEVFRGILGDGKEQDKEEKLAEKAKADEAAQNEREGKAYRNKAKGKGKGGPAEDVVEDEDAKMIAAVLTGVNRAVPFAKIEDAAYVVSALGSFSCSMFLR
jgi:ribosome biogenesis protein MAK21